MSSRISAGDATGPRSETGEAVDNSADGSDRSPRSSAPFETTGDFALFDYFRVPYAATRTEPAELPPGVAALSVRGETRYLAWPTHELLKSDRTRAGAHFLGSAPIFGPIAGDHQARRWLGGGDGWYGSQDVLDETGVPIASVWRRDDGTTFLPFDPNDLIKSFWSEAYLKYVRPATLGRAATLARRAYYRARPLLPRSVQMGMRRSFSRVQSKAQFPRWPIETALHDLYDLLFALICGVAERPIPYIAFWPRDRSWAFVLTHDVETEVGYNRLPDLHEVELELGYRSSWNLVPRGGYDVDDGLVEALKEQGFEVGVHGLRHDGRDLSSAANLRRRLPEMRRYAEQWGATGFRSPGTLRSAEVMPQLGFDYDSSYTDTAPFEPQAGGCCTWLPYMLGDVVELPITLTQDHTLFDLLGHRDAGAWLEKAHFLRERGGMALVLTHSDYVGNGYLVDAYRQLLEEFAGDTTAWRALPRDVSDWTRRRSKSTLQEVEGGWSVVGPAEGDARVEFMSPETAAV